jgi:23S rRNA (adenine-N6)-dimethyltransferase
MARRNDATLWRSQNFLRDPQLIEELVTRAAISRSDTVYDLGAGSGNLTAALAAHARRVVAIERDPVLAERLRRRFASQRNVVIREADIKNYRLPRSNYVVFASPPFDITTEVVNKVTSAVVPPRDAYLVLQVEAARRFARRPRMTLAALLIAPWFAVGEVHRFARADFVPAPSVDAVFVRLHKRGPPLLSSAEQSRFHDFAAALFTPRTATLHESIRRVLGRRAAMVLIREARVEPDTTPTRVPLAVWLRLYGAFSRLPKPAQQRVAGAAARLRRQQQRLKKLHRSRVPRRTSRGMTRTSES